MAMITATTSNQNMDGSANITTQYTAAGMLNLDMIKYKKSISLACHWHAGQTYGDNEYMHHLWMVDSYLRKYYKRINQPVDQDVLITGMLHDILEDTKIPKSELKEFGWNVFLDVTSLSRIKPPVKYYKQISKSENATIVKFADRICNLKSSIQDNNYKMIAKYINERNDFAILYNKKYRLLYMDLELLYLKAWTKLSLKSLSNLIHL